jgi:hypothetical protein
MELTTNEIKTLVNVKVKFRDDPDSREAFIDAMLSEHPRLCLSMLEGSTITITNRSGDTFIMLRHQYRDMKDVWSGGRKIDSIKMLRAVTGWGLKDAKDFCEDNFN